MGGCPWRRASDALSGVPGGPEGPWPTLGAHKLQPCLLELCKFFSQCLCRPDQPRSPQRRYRPTAISSTSDRQTDRQTERQTDRQTERWWWLWTIFPSISPETTVMYMFAFSIIQVLSTLNNLQGNYLRLVQCCALLTKRSLFQHNALCWSAITRPHTDITHGRVHPDD